MLLDLPVLAERVNQLTKRFEDHERRQNKTMEQIQQSLEAISKRIDGRPSWAVALALTALCSITTGLIVASVMRGG